MPRRNRSRRPRAAEAEPRALGAALGWGQTESAADGEWLVRGVPGDKATKVYRCPGCEHEIRPGVPHVVAWPADRGGIEDRRHWHSGCWSARRHRRPTRRHW
ncbi:MAG: hypothetical protein JOZ47_02060 [Kutzneria sp.]|nr:hypothetical protein [Kutzneria sp.]MBV9843846.1 hypothetical protein [Kutzneria sp.]